MSSSATGPSSLTRRVLPALYFLAALLAMVEIGTSGYLVAHVKSKGDVHGRVIFALFTGVWTFVLDFVAGIAVIGQLHLLSKALLHLLYLTITFIFWIVVGGEQLSGALGGITTSTATIQATQAIAWIEMVLHILGAVAVCYALWQAKRDRRPVLSAVL